MSAEQAAAILEYEKSRPQKSWILSGFLALGIVIVCVGIISLVAANWDQISGHTKLVADFLLLSCVGFATINWRAHTYAFDALLMLFMCLALASIGLISQVFHTGGELYEALLFWSLITAPPMLAARTQGPPLIWIITALGSCIYAMVENKFLYALVRHAEPTLFMTTTLVAAFASIAARILSGNSPQTRAFRSAAIIAMIIALGFIEVFGAESRIAGSEAGRIFVPYLPGHFMAILCVIGIANQKSYKKSQVLALTMALVAFILPFHFPALAIKASVAYASCSVLTATLIAAFCASIGAKRTFNLMLLLIAVRFVILYFQALGGLAMTGFGLVISGLVVIASAVLWHKYRKQIDALFTRWMLG